MELRSGRATWGLTRDKRSVRWGGRGRWPFFFPLCLGHLERKGDFFSLQELDGGKKRSSRVIEDWICCCGPVARSVHAALLLLQRPLPREPPEAVFEMLTPHSSPQDWTKLKKDSTAATRIGQPGLGGGIELWSWQGEVAGLLQFDISFFFPFNFLHPPSRPSHRGNSIHLPLCNDVRRRHCCRSSQRAGHSLTTTPSEPRCQAETGGRRSSSRGPGVTRRRPLSPEPSSPHSTEHHSWRPALHQRTQLAACSSRGSTTAATTHGQTWTAYPTDQSMDVN